MYQVKVRNELINLSTLEKPVQLHLNDDGTATVKVALNHDFDFTLFDRAVEEAHQLGYELTYDSPSKLTKEWEIWTLEPIFQER